MKLVVGLGNPGKQYLKTRHNVGFMAIDMIAQKHNVLVNKKKFNGLYNELNINGEKLILLKPQCYMNLSGSVVKSFLDFYKIKVDDILIIHDDLDLPCGHYKLKYKGGSGGHNGLKDIEYHLKTNEYKRVKIGISNNKTIDTKEYVLGTFTSEQEKLILPVIEKMTDIIDDYLILKFENLMNKYNAN